MRNEIAKGLETSPPETINKEISDNQLASMDKTIEFWNTLGDILKFDPLDLLRFKVDICRVIHPLKLLCVYTVIQISAFARCLISLLRRIEIKLNSTLK